jgi:hypothetical protein
MLHDWCYAMDVLDRADMPIPVAEIEARMWNAIRDANGRRQRGEEPVPVGVLTTHDRNTWAKVGVILSGHLPRFAHGNHLGESSFAGHLTQ